MVATTTGGTYIGSDGNMHKEGRTIFRLSIVADMFWAVMNFISLLCVYMSPFPRVR